MENRWLRMFLFLVVIPAFLGITLKVSSANKLSSSPFFLTEVKAFRTSSQAVLIGGDRAVNDGSMVRAKQLYAFPDNIVAGIKTNTMPDISLLVENVAGRLVQIQRTTNSGWPRDLTDRIADPSDPEDVLPSNYGTVGMGLLMAYKMDVKLVNNIVTANTPKLNKDFLTAATNAGDALEGMDADSLVSTDIIFLYGLSKVYTSLNNTVLAAKYKVAGLDSLKNFITTSADDVYTYYDTPVEGANVELKQLKLWQLANWVEAAKLYALDGDTSEADVTDLNNWANELMVKIVACQDPAGGFYYEKTSVSPITYSVRTAGHAKVVEVLKRFYADDYQAKLKDGLAYLKGLQYDKAYVSNNDVPKMRGAFYCGGYTVVTTPTAGDINTLTPWNKVTLQDQCYGIQAMAYNFQTTWKKRDNYKNTYWGANYLIKSMTAVGPENYEVFVDRVDFDPASDINTDTAAVPRTDRNSEAIQALYYSCKEGDVTRSGNITAYNALEVLKAGIGVRELNGPEIVAADRHNDGVINIDPVITNNDIDAILSDAVGDHQPIHSFLGN